MTASNSNTASNSTCDYIKTIVYLGATLNILIGSVLMFEKNNYSSWAFLAGSVLFVINSTINLYEKLISNPTRTRASTFSDEFYYY